jgi:hypothetical protein
MLVYKVLQANDVGGWVTAGVGDISWLEGTQAHDAARQVLLRRGCLVGNGRLTAAAYMRCLPCPTLPLLQTSYACSSLRGR